MGDAPRALTSAARVLNFMRHDISVLVIENPSSTTSTFSTLGRFQISVNTNVAATPPYIVAYGYDASRAPEEVVPVTPLFLCSL